MTKGVGYEDKGSCRDRHGKNGSRQSETGCKANAAASFSGTGKVEDEEGTAAVNESRAANQAFVGVAKNCIE
jgi:hypothetical protein